MPARDGTVRGNIVKIKRDKVDIVFSQLIRERDDWTCQRCGTKYAPNSRGLECSHFFSRRHQATRHDPDNACAKCSGCHSYLGGEPILFQSWIRTYLGEVRYSELLEKHRMIKKRTKVEKAELYQHLKSELAKLQAKRAAGHTGVLEVVGYD